MPSSRPSWKRSSRCAWPPRSKRPSGWRTTARLRSSSGGSTSSGPQYAVNRAERRYRAVDPDNRLVARRLEQEWEEALRALEAAKAELARREEQRPRVLSATERETLIAVGADLASVWHAPTTTAA